MLTATDNSGLTLSDLMREVGRECGALIQVDPATGLPCAPMLPTSEAGLARLRQACVDAARQFLSADPNWSFLRQTVTLTLTPDTSSPTAFGDARRHRLPAFVRSAPMGSGTLETSSGAFVYKVLNVGTQLIVHMQADNGTRAGPPCYMAVRTTPNPNPKEGVAHELLLDRVPDATYTLRLNFMVHWAWTLDDERHIFGGQHDHTLSRLAVLAYRRADGVSGGEYDRLKLDADEALARSRALDAEKRQAILGVMGDATLTEHAEPIGPRWVGFSEYGA
jgi:hypothetical protein